MLKVVSVVDKVGTALDRLSKGMTPFMDNLDYSVVDVHPKRPDPEQLARFEQLAQMADVMDYQYFKTAEMLRERYPWLKDIPSVLTHNNPYSITESDWNSYQCVIGNNKTIHSELKKTTQARTEYIHLATDPYFWTFNDEYQAERSVIMVANRIEGKKGILPVAQACREINAKMYLVGNVSDMNYFHEVIRTGVVEFFQNIPDERLKDLYNRAGIHVCNSVDNFESGTLPVVEAMFSGVPVLSRKVGHVPDFYSGDNLVMGEYEPDDVSSIAEHLDAMFADKKKLETLRNEGFFSIKHLNFERRAYAYQKLWRELLPGEPVSVIVPIAGKEETTRECLNSIATQSHRNIEIIVVDDGEVAQEDNVKSFASTINLPVRYMKTGGVGYNLAKARNLGIIEATSEVLVFCDQRMMMQPTAVEEFLKHLKPKTWLYGSKGVKKPFVENFSCVYRNELIVAGMFNERITQYGGMSQEIRSRAIKQGLNLQYLEEAKAIPSGKSANRVRKKYEILRTKNMLWKIGMF